MTGEISLGNQMDEGLPEGETGVLGPLENRVDFLLDKIQELTRQRDELTVAIDSEREKTRRLEKRLELFTQDRENVKTRIDQLLLRLKGIDF
jgi:chromosome segregation ATPase